MKSKRGGAKTDPALDALDSIAQGARRARLGERLPPDKRPTPEFVISIGLGSPEMEDDEDDEEMRAGRR